MSKRYSVLQKASQVPWPESLAVAEPSPGHAEADMIAIITGGRDYGFDPVDSPQQRWMDSIGIKVLIEGGAAGADACAKTWADLPRDHGGALIVLTIRADWDQHGKAAGPIRNRLMAEWALRISKTDNLKPVVLAFPGNRGTASMKRIAREMGIEVLEFQG